MDQQSDNPQKTRRGKSELREWIVAAAIAVILVLVFRFFIFQPFVVDGPSMHPNFYTNEKLIVDKVVYRFRHPKRGEVIIFHANPQQDFIKRVIATPGETIKVSGDNIYVNGKKIKEPYIQAAEDKAHQIGTTYNDRNYPETKVPPGHLFVMGDNRSDSEDSRFPQVGFVPYSKVIGRADFIFWPFKDFGMVKQ